MKDPFINSLDDEPDVLAASNEGSEGVFSGYQIDSAAFYEPAVDTNFYSFIRFNVRRMIGLLLISLCDFFQWSCTRDLS